jgi:phage terminase small subunit
MTRARRDALTPKQARFVAEYLVDLNATQAAIRAGYSAESANVNGPRLLVNAGISEAIRIGKANQLAAADLSAARVLEELRRVALLDPGAFWHADGTLKAIVDLPPDVRSGLAGYEVVIKNVAAGDGQQDTVHKIKFWDKVRSLEILAKHFGLLVEKIELKEVAAEARVARLVAARRRVGDTKEA